MSLYFELSYKRIEEQIETICNKIDEIEEKLKELEEKK